MHAVALSLLLMLPSTGEPAPPVASPPPSCTACTCLKPPFAECSLCCYGRVLASAPLSELASTLKLTDPEIAAIKGARAKGGSSDEFQRLLNDKANLSLKKKLDTLKESDFNRLDK